MREIEVGNRPGLFAENGRPRAVEPQFLQSGKIGAQAVEPAFAEAVVGAVVGIVESAQKESGEQLLAETALQKLVLAEDGIELRADARTQHVDADMVERILVLGHPQVASERRIKEVVNIEVDEIQVVVIERQARFAAVFQAPVKRIFPCERISF